MKANNFYTGVILLGLAFGFSSDAMAQQQPQIIELEETIRVNKEQPKVLSIVPWQLPQKKQSLTSPIVARINKKFKPLERTELQREIVFFAENTAVKQEQDH